ncbi:MAG: radical SAM protein, partial [Deltaproteobacteria bacterium]|nr:radical SAM protein [Deltaproteobacteria bacterium]
MTARHPCFDAGAAGSFARLHLPVAPLCNVSCNYCSRLSDCPNESRPGLCSRVLSPREALERFRRARREIPRLSVAGLAGPGETLACPDETLATLELVGREDPGITLCLSTNGLMLPHYAAQLHSLGLRHVTVTVNAVDPGVGARIYRRARYLGSTYRGEDAARLILSNQLEGIRIARGLGMAVKVNTVLVGGVNGDHVPAVAERAGGLGAELGNVVPLIPVPGTPFQDLPAPSPAELREARWKCGTFLPQMTHCRQCRADAAGLLGDAPGVAGGGRREAGGCAGPCGGRRRDGGGPAGGPAEAARDRRAVAAYRSGGNPRAMPPQAGAPACGTGGAAAGGGPASGPAPGDPAAAPVRGGSGARRAARPAARRA